MSARIRNFFSFNNNNNNNNNNNHSHYKSNPNLRGQAYEDAIASDAPVRGSYPVAGNGPNVLEQMQRSRAKRDQRETMRRQTIRPAPVMVHDFSNHHEYRTGPPFIVAEAPEVPRSRGKTFNARPYTAPEEEDNRQMEAAPITSTTIGRTQSVFSMRSLPSSFLSSDKRDSVRSRMGTPPLPPLPASPTVSLSNRRSSIYQHTAASSTRSSRRFSQHVDLLDAYSDITQSNDVIKRKARASGLRNYGEDVADRNIINYGDKSDRDHRSNSANPDRSYTHLKSPSNAATTEQDGHQPHAAPAHIRRRQHHNDASHDDTASSQPDAKPHHIPGNTWSTGTPAFPPRISSMQHNPQLGRDGDAYDVSARPTTSSSAHHDIPPKDIRRHTLHSQHPLAGPAAPDKVNVPTITPLIDSYRPLPPATHTSRRNQSSTAGSTEELRPHSRRTQSGSLQDFDSIAGERKRRQKGSVSYSAFPNTSTEGYARSRNTSISSIAFQAHQSSRHSSMTYQVMSPPSTANGAPEMKNGIDLSNSTDVDVTKKIAPGVVHEHITPIEHEIREEKITREIHNYDVIHRVQPIIETEVLPAKHFVSMRDADGQEVLVEVPESRPTTGGSVSSSTTRDTKQTIPRKPVQNDSQHQYRSPRSQDIEEGDESAEPPTIALARGEPSKTRRRSRGWSATSGAGTKSPVKSASPPSRQPRYIGPGLGDLSGIEHETSYSDGEGERVQQPTPKPSEEELLFRDSGYGSGGALPGLTEKAPMAREAMGLGREIGEREEDDVIDSDERRGRERGRDVTERGVEEKEENSPVGEATKALRRMKGCSSSVGHVKFRDGEGEADGGPSHGDRKDELRNVVSGIQNLDVRE